MSVASTDEQQDSAEVSPVCIGVPVEVTTGLPYESSRVFEEVVATLEVSDEASETSDVDEYGVLLMGNPCADPTTTGHWYESPS
jgi:hypothetical protein